MDNFHALFVRSMRFRETSSELRDAVAGAGNLDPEAAVDVYRKMYWYRQVDACFSLLPKSADAIGHERFTKIICDIIHKCPSKHYALEHYVLELSELLFLQLTDATQRAAVRLERASLAALVAPNDPGAPLRAATIATPAFATIPLRWHRSSGIVEDAPGAAIAVFQLAESGDAAVWVGRPTLFLEAVRVPLALASLPEVFTGEELIVALADEDGSPVTVARRLARLVELGAILHASNEVS